MQSMCSRNIRLSCQGAAFGWGFSAYQLVYGAGRADAQLQAGRLKHRSFIGLRPRLGAQTHAHACLQDIVVFVTAARPYFMSMSDFHAG